MGKNKHKQCTWCPFLYPQMSATDAHAYHLCSPCSLFSLSALSGPVSFCPFLHPPFIYAFRSSSRNARQAVRGTSHACRSSRQQNLSIFNNGRNPGCGYDAINFSISQPPFPDPRWRRRGGPHRRMARHSLPPKDQSCALSVPSTPSFFERQDKSKESPGWLRPLSKIPRVRSLISDWADKALMS